MCLSGWVVVYAISEKIATPTLHHNATCFSTHICHRYTYLSYSLLLWRRRQQHTNIIRISSSKIITAPPPAAPAIIGSDSPPLSLEVGEVDSLGLSTSHADGTSRASMAVSHEDSRRSLLPCTVIEELALTQLSKYTVRLLQSLASTPLRLARYITFCALVSSQVNSLSNTWSGVREHRHWAFSMDTVATVMSESLALVARNCGDIRKRRSTSDVHLRL